MSMINRRDLVIGTAALAATQSGTAQGSQQKGAGAQLILEAPEDVVVSTLPRLQGRVKAGELIATLTSTRLELVRSRLDSAEADLNIQDRFFTEGRQKDLLDMLDAQVESVKFGLKAATILRDIAPLDNLCLLEPVTTIFCT
jgi:hypothetical protein